MRHQTPNGKIQTIRALPVVGARLVERCKGGKVRRFDVVRVIHGRDDVFQIVLDHVKKDGYRRRIPARLVRYAGAR